MRSVAAPAVLLVPCLLAACEPSGEPAAGAASLERDARPRLVLLAEPVLRGGTCTVELATGPGAPLTELRAAIDPCVVRVGGDQSAAVPRSQQGRMVVEVPLPATVDVLVGLSAKLPDGGSWHGKTIVPVRDADGQAQPTTAVAQRIGLRAEITPLADPATLCPGDDLPLRLHVDEGASADIELEVEVDAAAARTAPSAVQRSRISTGPGGFAVLPLRASGRYIVTAHVALRDGAGTASERGVTTLSFFVEDRR